MSQTAPPPIVPVPAARYDQLRGRRVIIGVPGVGFRADLRADNSVVQGRRTFVPVLSEHDYYRAELNNIEAFAVLVPIDRVWVEEPEPARVHALQALDAPLVRPAQAVRGDVPLLGRRLVQVVPDGYVRNLRAISEPHMSHAGTLCVRVCAEPAWYAWALDGSAPSSMELPTLTLWLE